LTCKPSFQRAGRQSELQPICSLTMTPPITVIIARHNHLTPPLATEAGTAAPFGAVISTRGGHAGATAPALPLEYHTYKPLPDFT
jgi:hypothetical protein